MLLFLDLNPILKRRYQAEKFPKGKKTAADRNQVEAHGMGVEMARIAANMNEDASLMTFLGGANGQQFSEKMMSMPIRLIVKKLRDETQEMVSLEEKSSTTEVISQEPRITREDMIDFYAHFREINHRYGAIAIAHYEREQLPENMLLSLVKLANNESLHTVVSGRYQELDDLIAAKPYALLLEREDLSRYFDRTIEFTGDIVNILKSHFSTIPVTMVMGSRGLILACENQIVYGKHKEALELMTTSGVMAGFASAIGRNYDPEMILRLSLACGLAAHEEEMTFGTVKAKMNEVEFNVLEEMK